MATHYKVHTKGNCTGRLVLTLGKSFHGNADITRLVSAEPDPEWRCLGFMLQPQGKDDLGFCSMLGWASSNLEPHANLGSKPSPAPDLPGDFKQAMGPETLLI